MREAAVLAGAVLLILSSAAVVSDGVALGQIPAKLTPIVGGNGILWFWVISVSGMVVAGALLEGLAALILFAPLLLPVALGFGVSPIHYAIVILVAMGIGTFLPPIGVGLYIACATGGEVMANVIRPSAFYTGVLILGLAVLAAVPAVTLLLPAILGPH
jgi:TRAP-type C4-dicarboxylate transport system permease large subunit